MDEYIEREAVKNKIWNTPLANDYDTKIFFEVLDAMPTADVVPRAEVEKIFGLIDDIVESWKIEDYSKDSGCIVRVSYNGKMIAKCLAELKKKYRGE